MSKSRRALAALELLLIGPAALFLGALFVRNLQPLEQEPAHTAQAIVQWYAQRPQIGLWLLLIVLPLIALVTGGVTILLRWNDDAALRSAATSAMAAARAQLAMLLVAAATLAAGGILAIVALHALSD
jgi:hypothetical protein